MYKRKIFLNRGQDSRWFRVVKCIPVKAKFFKEFEFKVEHSGATFSNIYCGAAFNFLAEQTHSLETLYSTLCLPKLYVQIVIDMFPL